MDIDRCNSIFELFAAFNFTYSILSEPSEIKHNSSNNDDEQNNIQNEPKDSFVDIVDRRLFKPYSKFFRRGNLLKNQINLKIESVESLCNDYKNDANLSKKLAVLDGLGHQFKHLKNQCGVWISEIEEIKQEQKDKINDIFPYLSFFLAIFCISILGLSISQSNFKHFTLFLLLSFSFYIYKLIVNSKDKNDYVNLSKRILIGISIITLIHFIIEILIYCNTINSFFLSCILYADNNIYVKVLLILAAIILPFSHFIYAFFFVAGGNSTIKVTKLNTIESYEKDFKYISEQWQKLIAE